MTPILVEQILPNAVDDTGKTIRTVYYRNPPLYAIYRTDERVMIKFADGVDGEHDREAAQRTAIAPLAPLRGQINSLIDGWRLSKKKRLRDKAVRYDRRVADALLIGLETDVAAAAQLLEEIKEDLLEERKSFARVLYVLWAAGAVAVTALLGAAISACFTVHSCVPNGLWLALVTGTTGAFFSIAQAIRSRNVLTDLQMSGNIADAVLRVLIGGISGVVLVALLISKLAGFTINGHDLLADTICTPLHGCDADVWTTKIMVAGFVAGFLERLIPDLLAKAAATEERAPAPPAPGAGEGGAARAAPTPAAPTPTAPNPVAPPTGEVAPAQPPAPAPIPAPAASEPEPEQEQEETDGDHDTCLAHDPVTEAEATPDELLPPATGGVAKS